MSIRANSGHFYDFTVCEDGTYTVARSDGIFALMTLRSGATSAIHIGLGQQNKIAVVASGSTMTFYVNEQQVDQIQDSSYTSGAIGLLVHSVANHPTDVAYTNARAWTL
jgi:hypothetical protein